MNRFYLLSENDDRWSNMMEPVRILHVLNGLGIGGAESYIMNVYRNLDRKKIQFDFLIRSDREKVLADEIEQMGGRIFLTSAFPRHWLKNAGEVYSFFRGHPEYRIVHVHANAAMYLAPLFAAKKYHVPCRIVHSHNTRAAGGLFFQDVHFFNRHFLGSLATDRFACSEAAGRWMFGGNSFTIVRNAVEAEKFAYDQAVRNDIRAELNVSDQLVMGHIGRFVRQKNHAFLIDIFREIHRKNQNSVLMLVGSGELEPQIKQKAADLGLSGSVLFLGVRDDVSRLLQAMDVFVFPSLYEGLGIAIIEAQAAGIPILASDRITKESKITDLLSFFPLSRSPEEWADRALRAAQGNKRRNTCREIRDAGYDIRDLAEKMRDFYLSR